jgi:deazaflavin-dependent oxidoreductase (nitroreductase family)
MPQISPELDETLRRFFHRFNRFMLLMWRLGLGSTLSVWPALGGRIMVLCHTGRKSGLRRLTPLNFAEDGGDVYITAGFGPGSDWYRNIKADPEIELWLPRGRVTGRAEELPPDDPRRLELMRAVLRGSGLVAPLAGVSPRLPDAELAAATERYRLVRIADLKPIYGPGGPGELAWVWPLAAALAAAIILVRGLRRGGR